MAVRTGVLGVEIERRVTQRERGEQRVVPLTERTPPVVLEDAPLGEVFEAMPLGAEREGIEIGIVGHGSRSAESCPPTTHFSIGQSRKRRAWPSARACQERSRRVLARPIAREE